MKKKIKNLRTYNFNYNCMTIKTCLIEVYVVPTGSMEKTILIGDMLIGNKFIYGMKHQTGLVYPIQGLDFCTLF